MSHVPVAQVSTAIKAFFSADQAPNTVPETEALWFYGMNHAMSEVRKARALYEPLGALQPFVEDYYRQLSPKAVRAFYYLMIICTREARHLNHTPNLEPKVVKAYGQVAWDWASGNKGEQAAHTKLLNSPPAMLLGSYVDALRMTFYDGKWPSSYGGPAWGAVTDCLCRFVHGEFTAEMMLDTVWTLAHNNGPIFNKGHMYGAYSNNLYKILDVQASGQIPEFLLTDQMKDHYGSPDLVAHMQWLKATFPEAIGGYVDYFLVEALGAKHKYTSEKMAQAKLHGPSIHATQVDAVMLKKAKEAKEAAAKAAAAEAAAELLEAQTWFEVMPGMKVQKIQRQMAA
jgi:hypothetical protein